MARSTNSDTLPFVESRYELGMMASQRVRDLNGGADPIVDRKNDKLTVLSLREIATGKLNMDKLRHEFIQNYKETPVLSESDTSLEISAEDPSLRELDAELANIIIPVVEESEEIADLDQELKSDAE